MKSLFNIIQEKLKIGSKSKISNDKGILDKDINSLDELHDVINQYFKLTDFNTVTSPIERTNQKWKPEWQGNIVVGPHFYVTFYKDPKNPIFRKYKLRFAEYRDYFLFYMLEYKKGQIYYSKVFGISDYHEFRVGYNLLKFIENVVKHTKNPNILEIFKEL